jgi:hypothetical protein
MVGGPERASRDVSGHHNETAFAFRRRHVFDRQKTPAMTAQDESDTIAFLQTLTDGYKPE